MGGSITLKLKLTAVGEAHTVRMEMDEMPEGWSATFRGGGRIINSVYVEADSSETIDARLDPPENPELGILLSSCLLRARDEKLDYRSL